MNEKKSDKELRDLEKRGWPPIPRPLPPPPTAPPPPPAKSPNTQSETNGHKPVLVTTQHRGVFFGYLTSEPSKEKVTIAKCRNVTYWDAATKSFLGLAATGPTPNCRVSAAAGSDSTLFDITGVFVCTPEAVEKFEAAPWA